MNISSRGAVGAYGMKTSDKKSNPYKARRRTAPGGPKRVYRIVDFRRYDKDGVPAKVAHIEYDPNRTARIALLHYADGEKRYIVAPKGLEQGTTVESGPNVDIKPGNNLPLRNIPVGTTIHCVELRPGGGAKIARTAGSRVQLVATDSSRATLQMASGEMRWVDVRCRATVGDVGGLDPAPMKWAKSGRLRAKGGASRTTKVVTKREKVRTVVAPPSADIQPDPGERAPGPEPGLDVQSQLKALAATRFLLGLRESRTLATAVSAGMTQTEIAKSLGISQPTVHRLLRQLRATAAPETRTVREIIAEAVAGITDRESMLAELTQREPQPGEYPADSTADGYVLGEWDEVVDAWETGWLTDDEYEHLFRL